MIMSNESLRFPLLHYSVQITTVNEGYLYIYECIYSHMHTPLLTLLSPSLSLSHEDKRTEFQ